MKIDVDKIVGYGMMLCIGCLIALLYTGTI